MTVVVGARLTLNIGDEELLGACLSSPLYDAVIECSPIGRVEIDRDAIPFTDK
jgi:hypothetical protein